jgi:archaellum component FlaC
LSKPKNGVILDLKIEQYFYNERKCMTPRKQRVPRTRSRKKAIQSYYFQNLPPQFLSQIPDIPLDSLEDEINLSRYVIKQFFDQLLAIEPDLKELGEAIYRIGTTVMNVARLVSIHDKLEGETKPVDQLQKSLEEILSDVQSTSSKKE